MRKKLCGIFGDDTLVLLDAFHWVKRWDNVVSDVNSAEASVFRGMIHKSLFVVESSEFNWVKFMLRRELKREPLAKETLKEAKATMPEAETLLRQIDAVVQCACFSDLTNQMPVPANTNQLLPAPVNTAVQWQRNDRSSRCFKPLSREMRKLIDNQMKHVRDGCLSDPHKSIVEIHRVNPINDEACTA